LENRHLGLISAREKVDVSEAMNREKILTILEGELPYLRQEYGVERLALFGSFAQAKADENSDVDLLVQLSKPLGFKFIQLAVHLENKLGRKVDLVTFGSLERGALHPRRAHIAENITRTLIYV
jgi:hypothetical protein